MLCTTKLQVLGNHVNIRSEYFQLSHEHFPQIETAFRAVCVSHQIVFKDKLNTEHGTEILDTKIVPILFRPER